MPRTLRCFWSACTGSRRIVLQHGIDSPKDTTRMPPSFLMLWPTRRHWFGMHTLGFQDLAMTSMCSTRHLFSEVRQCRSTTGDLASKWAHISTTMGPTFRMGSIWSRLLSWGQSQASKVRKNFIFIVLKKWLGNMWRGFLRFCNPNMLLCKDRLDFGIRRTFGTSWMLVWSCTTFGLHYFYDLMEIRGRPSRWEDWVRRFMQVYHDIRELDRHNNLQKDIMENWWAWHGEQNS